MAVPAQLVAALHEVTGASLATLTDIDRKLAKAGLRTRTGRGFSAARMTPRDAAHLLTALLGALHANASADTVARYAATRPHPPASRAEGYVGTDIDELVLLKPRHSFVDAMEALIVSTTRGALARLSGLDGGRRTPDIEIFALAERTRASIRISGLPNGTTASVQYADGSSVRLKRDSGDLENSRRITGRTIFEIGKLLAQEVNHART